MLRYDSSCRPAAPPGFLEAKNRRQKARAAGLSPDYWYPVAQSAQLGRGRVLGSKFWGRPLAVYRDEHGRAHALEDRCAHRQVQLSLGAVRGCRLVCRHHGWEYDRHGQVVAIPHETHGKQVSNLRVGSFPVQERYGLIWIFPGNPSLAAARKLPEIPELEGKGRWSAVRIDLVCKTHHSMIIDALSDPTRARPHRKHPPFVEARLTRCEAAGDKVHVRYEAKLGAGGLLQRLVGAQPGETSRVDLCFDYPYLWSSTDDVLKDCCFVTPLDEKSTHVFFISYSKTLKLPGVALPTPPRVFEPLLQAANKLLVAPLLREDAVACEAEQDAYSRFFDAPVAELSPAVNLLQQLTIRKWEEYLSAKDLLPLSRVSP